MKNLMCLLVIIVVALNACNKVEEYDIQVPAPQDRNVVQVSGKITTDQTWKESEKHLLIGFVYVENGAQLIIEAGSIVLGDKISKGTLIIKPGGKINARGTSTKPIVFTSASAKGSRSYGDWGGIIMLGKAPVNKNPATIEGENISTFGGTNSADNSGVLNYVRIEFAGIAFETDKEINGLTLGGVGSGTLIDYVQISYSGDDAFEWFGGTVNATHLISYRPIDDDFDTDWGYSGNVQYGYILRDPAIADQCSCSDSNGLESDNDSAGSNAAPQTSAKFANISIFISSGTVNSKYRSAFRLRRNTAISIYNTLVAAAFIKGGIELESAATQANFETGKMNLNGLIVTGMNKPIVSGNSTKLNETSRKNQFGVDVTALGLSATYNSLSSPNATLTPSSRLLTAAYTTPSGFESNTYIGAFGTTNWAQGWTDFDPQNTNY